jgi:hypothetical protein
MPGTGRATAPVFQKFASDRFVADFIADPQHSLVFDDLVDRVRPVQYAPAPSPASALLAGKVASLYPRDEDGKGPATLVRLGPPGVRKIFLDTHSRHYLVVCELHCDRAGFPSPRAREVCQAGLVVRRRRLAYPDSAKAEAQAIVRDLVTVESAIAARRAELAGAKPAAKTGVALAARLRALFKVPAPDLATLQARRAELLARLAAWKDAAGASWVYEGWIPGPRERIGEWRVVEDSPQAPVEHCFPMWPLFADPKQPSHDATGRAIFFGVLPTASFDTDARGRARFDPDTEYQVRCFVRRHDPRCPRGEPPDCRGELVWSRATEPYRLAPSFDLQGTANRPVTIRMPDLGELAAQALEGPVGKFCPVKVVQPQTLSPEVEDNGCSGGSMSGPSTCFLAIPLITLVALFVFSLFLPIVVFLFGLWFLLALRICILPKIDFDATLRAELDAVAAAGVDLDADFSLTAELEGGGSVEFGTGDLNDDLSAHLSEGLSAAFGLDASELKGKLDGFSNAPLAAMAEGTLEASQLETDADVHADLGADLVFEPRRTREGAPA